MSDTMLIDLEMPPVDIDAMDEEIDQELKTTVTLAIETETLKKAVGKVEKAVAKKAVIDVYKMIYLDVQDTKLIFRGINSDYLTEVVVEQNEEKTNFKITGGKAGSVCFPGDKFSQIVKKLSHRSTEIKIEDYQAVIKSGRPKFELAGIDGDEFPRTPDLDGGTLMTIPSGVLSMIYDRTMYAASSKETRPVLTGVHHHLAGSRLKCVATDAHRLAQYVYELDQAFPEISLTIPVNVLAEAKKHLDATAGNVNLYIYDNQVVYEFQDVKVYARTLEDEYPNTDRLIFPSSAAGSRVVIAVGALRSLLDGSTVYNPNQPIIIHLKVTENQLRVNTKEAEVGAFEADLATYHGWGEDVVVGVNVRYLTDALSGYADEDYLTFEFLPAQGQKAIGLQPFRAGLLNGNPDCLELFVPVRSPEIDYDAPVVIENFQGVPEYEFNPFEQDFRDITN